MQRDGKRTRRGRGLLAWAVAGLYCAVHVCGLVVQKHPQYLRGPQQRSLVQLRLSVRPSLLLRRWRQPDGASEVSPDSKCLVNAVAGQLDSEHRGQECILFLRSLPLHIDLGARLVQKSVLLATIQKEIQRHDLSYFVSDPPSVAQG